MKWRPKNSHSMTKDACDAYEAGEACSGWGESVEHQKQGMPGYTERIYS